MKKTYLLKYNKKNFTTTKEVIVANIDDFWSTTDYVYIRYYRYKENIFNKNPKELIITGNEYVSFPHHTYLYNFPVEKVIFDCEIRANIENLKKFNNAKELEITHNGYTHNGYIRIENNYGLTNIENIIIPFNIRSFNDHSITNNKIKTITIKYEDIEEIIKLDDVFADREIDITINNENNILNINIESKYSKVNYKVYIDNNEIKYDKKYIKYEILPNKDKVLDLIELRNIYNCDFTLNEQINNDTVIISKEDYSILSNIFDKNSKLKEIIIKDNNEMSLFPRNINIKLDDKKYEYFDKTDMYDNNLLIRTNNKLNQSRYIIIINEDLSLIEIEKIIFIDVILDYNANKFKYENYILTIPFNDSLRNNVFSSKILKKIVEYSDVIIINKNTKKYKIKGLKSLSNELYQNTEKDFHESKINDYQENSNMYFPLKKRKTNTRNGHLPGPKG